MILSIIVTLINIIPYCIVAICIAAIVVMFFNEIGRYTYISEIDLIFLKIKFDEKKSHKSKHKRK